MLVGVRSVSKRRVHMHELFNSSVILAKSLLVSGMAILGGNGMRRFGTELQKIILFFFPANRTVPILHSEIDNLLVISDYLLK